jgi:hypothetical protein
MVYIYGVYTVYFAGMLFYHGYGHIWCIYIHTHIYIYMYIYTRFWPTLLWADLAAPIVRTSTRLLKCVCMCVCVCTPSSWSVSSWSVYACHHEVYHHEVCTPSSWSVSLWSVCVCVCVCVRHHHEVYHHEVCTPSSLLSQPCWAWEVHLSQCRCISNAQMLHTHKHTHKHTHNHDAVLTCESVCGVCIMSFTIHHAGPQTLQVHLKHTTVTYTHKCTHTRTRTRAHILARAHVHTHTYTHRWLNAACTCRSVVYTPSPP